MSFEFYALPEEQRAWLRDQLRREGTWWLSWQPGRRTDYFPIVQEADIDDLPLCGNMADLILYAGRCELSGPVWRNGPRGDRLDLVKSQAIEFSPSLTGSDSVLIQGRIAMHRPSEYLIEGIDPKPLSRWYRQMQRSLASLMVPDAVVVYRNPNGEERAFRGIGVTPGAVAWRQEGKQLKQLVEAPMAFDVRFRSSG